MPDITLARAPRLLALDQLLSRRSVGPLQEPAPDGADLDLILDAGLRAPDHGRLRPWRFVVIRGEARLVFGEKLGEAAAVRDPATAATLAERYRAWVRRTPMLIAAGGVMFVTADHGNAEQMYDEQSHQKHTQHTLNRVPALLFNGPASVHSLSDGKLADVAPTMLALMSVPQPVEMTGRSMLSTASRPSVLASPRPAAAASA